MIEGYVTADREATILLAVGNSIGATRSIETLIDTGFNGHVGLPLAVISDLGLSQSGSSEVVLGNGTAVEMRTYSGFARLGETMRRIDILQIEGGPVLGMALLEGHHLHIEAVVGGRVVIEPLR